MVENGLLYSGSRLYRPSCDLDYFTPPMKCDTTSLGSAMLIPMSGKETDEQCKQIAWEMICHAHPVEAHRHNPDGFWQYFHARAPDMTREQMVALLKECEEPTDGLC